MSVLEEVKLEAYQEGIEKGIEKGREEGREEGLEKGLEKGLQKGIAKGTDKEARANIRSLIIHLPEASDEEIASLLSKPVELVAQVRREMEAERGQG